MASIVPDWMEKPLFTHLLQRWRDPARSARSAPEGPWLPPDPRPIAVLQCLRTREVWAGIEGVTPPPKKKKGGKREGRRQLHIVIKRPMETSFVVLLRNVMYITHHSKAARKEELDGEHKDTSFSPPATFVFVLPPPFFFIGFGLRTAGWRGRRSFTRSI